MPSVRLPSFDEPTYRTINQEVNENLLSNLKNPLAKSRQDLEIERRNFRKKTDFTQWCNAKFAGVFFNPPANCI